MSSTGVSANPGPGSNGAGGRSAFTVSYQISPIILVGGIAQNVAGGMLPIVSLIQAQDYDLGLLSQSSDTGLEGFFANFTVLSGDSLMDNQVAQWPLANLVVAANAVIANPLKVSLLMVIPADNGFSWGQKQAVMTALQASLQQHTALGGYYNVATPSYVYQGCLLTGLHNVSPGDDGGQPQMEYQWDFVQPLITTQAAQGAQNTAMAKVTSQTAQSGDPPGSAPVAQSSTGQPASNVAPSLIPAARNPVGSNVVAQGQTGNTANTTAVAPIQPGS